MHIRLGYNTGKPNWRDEDALDFRIAIATVQITNRSLKIVENANEKGSRLVVRS